MTTLGMKITLSVIVESDRRMSEILCKLFYSKTLSLLHRTAMLLVVLKKENEN